MLTVNRLKIRATICMSPFKYFKRGVDRFKKRVSNSSCQRCGNRLETHNDNPGCFGGLVWSANWSFVMRTYFQIAHAKGQAHQSIWGFSFVLTATALERVTTSGASQRANWGEDAEEWHKRAVKLAPLHRAADGSLRHDG